MLTKRIIPCLDVKEGRVAKGTQFLELRDAGDPVECAKVYNAQGADELVFLDITASHEERKTMVDVVARTAESCFMPLTVGGGIRTVADMREMLLAGADKVGINTAAVKTPEVIDAAAEVNNQGMVMLLAGLGMQGEGWDRMTTVHLYHIVSALNRVGLGAEARMIAAEAMARG